MATNEMNQNPWLSSENEKESYPGISLKFEDAFESITQAKKELHITHEKTECMSGVEYSKRLG